MPVNPNDRHRPQFWLERPFESIQSGDYWCQWCSPTSAPHRTEHPDRPCPVCKAQMEASS